MQDDMLKLQNIVLGEIQNCLIVMQLHSQKWANSIHFPTNANLFFSFLKNKNKALTSKILT
jgi:hypothetical protein